MKGLCIVKKMDGCHLDLARAVASDRMHNSHERTREDRGQRALSLHVLLVSDPATFVHRRNVTPKNTSQYSSDPIKW